MKRDWLLIRAILCEEEPTGWDYDAVAYHKMLCSDAGYINVHVLKNHDGGFQFAEYPGAFLTPQGVDVAERLRNRDDLEAALRFLDEKHVGPASDILFWVLEKRTRQRLNGAAK